MTGVQTCALPIYMTAAGAEAIINVCPFCHSPLRPGRALLAVAAAAVDPRGDDRLWLTVSSFTRPTALALGELDADGSLGRVEVLRLIQPWDASVIELIEKEILKSNLGINPVNDGKIIRLPFPEFMEDRRKELAKIVKKMAEDSKVALRNTRRDAVDKIKKLEKDSLIREDKKFIAEEEVEKTMNKYMEELEKILKSKEKELLEI